jgi:hypothetical protein
MGFRGLFFFILVVLGGGRVQIDEFEDGLEFVGLGVVGGGIDEVIAVDDEPVGVFHGLVHFLYELLFEFAVGEVTHLVERDLFAGESGAVAVAEFIGTAGGFLAHFGVQFEGFFGAEGQGRKQAECIVAEKDGLFVGGFVELEEARLIADEFELSEFGKVLFVEMEVDPFL